MWENGTWKPRYQIFHLCWRQGSRGENQVSDHMKRMKTRLSTETLFCYLSVATIWVNVPLILHPASWSQFENCTQTLMSLLKQITYFFYFSHSLTSTRILSFSPELHFVHSSSSCHEQAYQYLPKCWKSIFSNLQVALLSYHASISVYRIAKVQKLSLPHRITLSLVFWLSNLPNSTYFSCFSIFWISTARKMYYIMLYGLNGYLEVAADSQILQNY